MALTAKDLIRELQKAVDANDGRNLFVGTRSMDDPEGYGIDDIVTVNPDEEENGIVIIHC